jgi:hypothetical protein
MGTVQRRVRRSRLPVRTVRSSWVIVRSSAVNVAVQPTSHNWPMLRSEWGWSCGKMWAVVASRGRCGRLISAVPVDRMVLPSGRDTVRGGRVLSVVGVGQADAVRKWPVLPVSAMAVEHSGCERGEREGGPVMDKQEVDIKLVLVSFSWLTSSGSPRHQRGAEGVAGSGRFQTVRSFRMFWMLGHPPWRLASVAVLQWPGYGLAHVALVWVALRLRPWLQQ